MPDDMASNPRRHRPEHWRNMRESFAALKVFDRRHGASCILCSEEYNYSRMVCASHDFQVG